MCAVVTTTPIAVAYRDESFLSQGISASAITIYVAAFYKDVAGVKTLQGLNSTSGWAEISLGGKYEVISFGTASVDSTTKVTTLTDVRRGLPQTGTTATFAAGTGRIWPKGAAFRVIDFSGYNQNAVYKDLDQTLTGINTFSGSVLSTGKLRLPIFANTGARDAAYSSPSNGDKAYVTGVGEQVYSGGAWVTINASSNSFGSTTVAGTYEEGTVAEQASHTATGGTGARLVPAVANLVTLGADGTAVSGAIPTLNTSVALDRTIGGLGTTSGTAYTLIANGTTSTGVTQSLASVGTLGYPLMSNGAGALPSFQTPYLRHLGTITASSASVGASSTSELTTAPTWTGTDTVPANSLAAGSTIKIHLGGSYRLDSGNLYIRLYLGGKFIGSVYKAQVTTALQGWATIVEVSVRTGGANGTFQSSGVMAMATDSDTAKSTILSDSSGAGLPPEATSVDFTSALQFVVKAQFSASDADHSVIVANGSLTISKPI